MKVLLVVALFALAAGIDAATNCHWGPSYWCKSGETARECRMTRYCEDNVWKGNSVSLEKGHVKGEVECIACKAVVEFIQQELEKNATEMEIEDGLKKVCHDLGSLESVCEGLLDSYFPQIWQLLINKVEPDEVCSELGLCNSSSSFLRKPKVGVAMSRPRKAGVGGFECEICQLVANYAKSLLSKNETEQQVQQALEEFCSQLGGLSSECKSLVDSYFPQIWQLLLQELDPKAICSQIGLCSSSKPLRTKGWGSRVKGVVCDACTLVAEKMVDVINTSSTEKDIEEALTLACNYMGGFAPVCRVMIKEAWPEIFSNLMNIVAQPQKLCVLMKLCSGMKVGVAMPRPREVEVGGFECEVCQLVVKFAKDKLADNSTEQQVEQALDEFCSDLGGLSSECKTLVDDYFPQIWQLLLQTLDPQAICSQLSFCSNSSRLRKKFKSQFMKAPRDSLCDLCKLATSYVKPFVDNNSTKDEVKEALEQVCGLLPGDLGDECKSLVDTYIDPIWSLLQQEVDSGEICVQLGLCNSTKTGLRTMKMKVSRPQDDLCDLCKLATNYIKPYVDSNTTQQEAKAAVEQVCSFLPGSISSDCSGVVDQYFDMIWQLLEQEIDSGDVCKLMGLCNSTKTVQLKKFKVAPKDGLCDLCHIVVSYVKPYVDNNSTQKEALEALEGVCGILPGDLSTQCTSLVDQDFPIIWGLLKVEVDTGAVCKQLQLCNSTLVRIRRKQFAKFSANIVTCEVCQLVSKELKTLMAKNNSQTEVQDALKKLCSIVPGSMGDNCTEMVNQYFLMGWVVMKQMVDMGTLCEYIKMCGSNHTSSFKYLHTEMQGVKDECGICKVVVETVQNILKANKTLEEAEHEMERVCPYMVGFSSECKKIIKMYLPQIWQFLEEEMDPSAICKEIKLCQSMKLVQLGAKPKLTNVKGIIECELCTLVMKEVVNLLDGNNTEQAIEEALDKVCGLIPKYGSECKMLVNEYSDKIVKLILSGVGPKEICKLITLCTSSYKTRKFHMAGGIECTVCKEVLTVAKVAIGSNTAEGEVAKVVEKVCDLVSPGIKPECKSFISTFGPQLIQLLAKAIEPAVICREIKLCSASSVMDPWAKTARKY